MSMTCKNPSKRTSSLSEKESKAKYSIVASTIRKTKQEKGVERIQIELLYFPISYTERCGTCMTTLETVLKIETEKKLRKIKIRFFFVGGGYDNLQ